MVQKLEYGSLEKIITKVYYLVYTSHFKTNISVIWRILNFCSKYQCFYLKKSYIFLYSIIFIIITFYSCLYLLLTDGSHLKYASGGTIYNVAVLRYTKTNMTRSILRRWTLHVICATSTTYDILFIKEGM